jgi:hypothetical protein
MKDAGVVQRSVLFDQAQRFVDALQAGVGFVFEAPDPESIDVPAGREQPEEQPVDKSRLSRLFC